MSDDNKMSALDRLRARRAEKEAVVDSDQPKRTVVVVDDEEPNRDALYRVLGSRYDVTTYANTRSAMDAIRRDGCPDLIVTDQRMAPEDGVTFLKKVIQVYPEAVSIIISGYADRGDLVAAINQAQVYAYVTKPWEPDFLLTTVEQALKVSRMKKGQRVMSNELEELGREMHSLQGNLHDASTGRLSVDDITAQLDRLTATLSKLGD